MSDMNRSQFKGATLNSIKDEQGRAEKALPKDNSFANRAGFHTVEEGKNWRRIAPAHKPDEPAYRAKSTIILECEVTEVDENGKETGKKETKMKNIFIATQHSELKDDAILMYIRYARQKAQDEIQDKDARSKYLAPINGWRDKQSGKWNWGITPSIDYVCYCWDDQGKLGRETLYPYMIDAMKKISVERADDDVEIIPDVFTDPDEGYPLIITKLKNEKTGKWETTVSCDLPNKKESWQEFFARTRLTDEQLAELMSKESLSELYKDVYTTRDWDMAIDGLIRFDEKYKYGIFENEEFLTELNTLKEQVPVFKPKEDDTVEEETKTPPAEIKAPPKVDPKTLQRKPEVSATQSEQTESVPVPKMKREISVYILEAYGSDYSLPEGLSREDLEKWYKLAKAGEELPFDKVDVVEAAHATEQSDAEVKSPAPEPVASETTSSVTDPKLLEQIDALRRKRGKAAGK